MRGNEKTNLHFTSPYRPAWDAASWLSASNAPLDNQAAEKQRRILDLYDAHSSSLYKYLRSLGLARVEAEDAVQEIFLRLATHFLKERTQDSNVRAWLFQVAHNLSMDIHRANKRNQLKVELTAEVMAEPADPGADPERTYLDKERMNRLDAEIERLTPQQRKGILLRAQGLRYMEIGTALGVSESRAIALVKRGLTRLSGGFKAL